MAFTLTVYAPTVAAPVTIHDSATGESLLYENALSSIARRVDLYTGQDAVASSGVLKTGLDNRDGLFSPDGLFAPQWRDVALVAAVDAEIVFVGRAEKITETTAGVRADVQWRDLVDDFIAQQVTGIPSRSGEDVTTVASTGLHATLTTYGIPVPPGLADVNLWFPERNTTIRKWFLPVVGALGWSLDWTGSIMAGSLTTGFSLRHEDMFGNQADIPVFLDKHLVGDPRWDSGREQIINLWTGRRRFFDAADFRFQQEDIEARGDPAPFRAPVFSRDHYGERSARLDLSQVRGTEAEIVAIADAVINRRAWPHPRATMTVRGPEAATLRIGDGFRSDFALGVKDGRGLARTWRVYGRTADLHKEITTLYVEQRDGRDADYNGWVAAGANQTEAA